MRALLRDVGISHHVLWQPHTRTYAMPPGWSDRWEGGPIFEEFRFTDAPSPFNGIGAVLNARYVFNAIEKLLFVTGILPVLVGDDNYAERQDDISYSTWHRKRGMSEHMPRTFFAPMSLALNFTHIDDISAEAMLRVMAYFARSKDASRAGFLDGATGDRLIEPIAAYLRGRGVAIDTAVPIAKLLFAGDRCSGARTGDGRTYEADSVILATPVHNAAKRLPTQMLRDPLVHGVVKLASSPVINAHLWFDKPISRYSNLIFGCGSLAPVHADLGQASPGYEWPGKSFVEICVAPADDLMKLDDATIVERVLTDMQKLYPLARESFVESKLVRVPKSVYRARPGAERLRRGARTPVRNLFLAGRYTNHRYPASIEGAMRSARHAADGVLEYAGARA